jgi:hypothetical protein
VGIHEVEYSIVERFSVLKAMCIEAEAVDVITVLDAFVVDISMAGKMDRTMLFQTSIEGTEGGIGPQIKMNNQREEALTI